LSTHHRTLPHDIVATDDAPQAIGPYSQVVRKGGLIFVSGQIPIDPNCKKLFPLRKA